MSSRPTGHSPSPPSSPMTPSAVVPPMHASHRGHSQSRRQERRPGAAQRGRSENSRRRNKALTLDPVRVSERERGSRVKRVDGCGRFLCGGKRCTCGCCVCMAGFATSNLALILIPIPDPMCIVKNDST